MKTTRRRWAGVGISAALVASLACGALMAGCSSNASNASNASSSASSTTQAAQEAQSRTFTDSAGRACTLTGTAENIAALRGSSYDKCLFFGKVGEVKFAASSKAWAQKVFPGFNPEVLDAPDEPNVESLAEAGTDLCLFWNTPEILDSLEQAGIPSVVGSDETNKTINSWQDFAQWMKDDLHVYADALGGEENYAKWQKWCDYADETFEKITSRTSKLSADEIASVYYIRGPEVLKTHANKSITYWYVDMAGGQLVTKDIDKKIAEVTAEQINEWNPDYIFMGRLQSTDGVVNNADFSNVKAVQDGNVFVNPCGVYEWDYGTEGVLFAQWLAVTLHPDLFPDIDIAKEVKWYYQEFYDYTLSDDDVQRILSNMAPA